MMATDSEIAVHLVMSTRAVGELRARKVLPQVGSGLDANRRAYCKHLRAGAATRKPRGSKSNLDAQRARLAGEQADRIAMQNAEMLANTAPRTAIRSALGGMMDLVRRRLGRVAVDISGDNASLRNRLAAAIDDALVDLSVDRAMGVGASAADAPAA